MSDVDAALARAEEDRHWTTRTSGTASSWAFEDRTVLAAEVKRLRRARTGSHEKTRIELAWLIWCFAEGYRLPEDRAILSNWIEDKYLTDEDNQARIGLLSMADEILRLIG